MSSLSPETIRPVYRTLSALGSSYLDVLSVDVVSRLQSRLVEVLTRLDIEDPFENLLCLAVLAKFASRPPNESDNNKEFSDDLHSPNVTALSPPMDKFASTRKYFESKRGTKTMDLAIFRAISACSENCTLSLNEIFETLYLSTEVFDAFGRNDRLTWISKNGGKVKKLHMKILRQDINSEVQCAVGNFVSCHTCYLLMHPRH